MLCDACKNNSATFHYSSNENGKVTEIHLCHSCAKKSGMLDDSNKILNPFGSIFENDNKYSSSLFSELLSGMFPESTSSYLNEASVCPFCGMRINEFMKGGKAGCAKCYNTFKKAISPTITKLHGKTSHAGKIPKGRTVEKTSEQIKEELNKLLNEAVQNQEYEKAAEYRDKIREIESKEIKGGEKSDC